ncbi:hypothetical protein AOQ84DRAFT_424589, partial [Glonium stellatum]
SLLLTNLLLLLLHHLLLLRLLLRVPLPFPLPLLLALLSPRLLPKLPSPQLPHPLPRQEQVLLVAADGVLDAHRRPGPHRNGIAVRVNLPGEADCGCRRRWWCREDWERAGGSGVGEGGEVGAGGAGSATALAAAGGWVDARDERR